MRPTLTIIEALCTLCVHKRYAEIFCALHLHEYNHFSKHQTRRICTTPNSEDIMYENWYIFFFYYRVLIQYHAAEAYDFGYHRTLPEYKYDIYCNDATKYK